MVRFSDIEDINKVDDGTMQTIYRHGIDVDSKMAPNLLDERQFLRLKIDVEEERKKGINSTMWDDMTEEEYLAQFKRNPLVTDEHLEKWKKNLIDFNHVFFNKKKPHLFTGLVMNEIEVEARAGTIPKKDRLRRATDMKEPHILEHLKAMEAQGIIKEVEELSEGFLSNVMLVFESRFVAGAEGGGKEVKKTRFTLDYRKVNQHLHQVHWHLPNMEDFRRKISSGEFSVFSNLDCTSYYYQLKISERTGKIFSGFWAANKLWVMLRLPMGWSLSGSWGQFWIDQAFKDHGHAMPFMDDLSLYSTSMEEMLEVDLPLALAICSAYNLKLSPNKAEICAEELRVLGECCGSGVRGISDEKKEKIKNLRFPEDKAQLVSALAFFSWFLGNNPRLSDALGPLRDLAKPKIKFRPTQLHRDAFEAAKERLLDPALGRLRAPSSRLEDELILATDSSHYALGAVLLQKLPPTSKEVEAGVPADSRNVYIVQVFSKTLPVEKRCLPIYIKEFYALDHAVEKFDFLLRARPFLVVVDNKVLRYWANLTKMDDAMIRRVLKLQTYDFKVAFIESRLHPADQVSRWTEDDKADGIYRQRFLEGRILNGWGQEVPLDRLFCNEAKKDLEQFFSSSKRTTQSQYSATAAVVPTSPSASAPTGDSPPAESRDDSSNPSTMVIEPGDAEEDGGVELHPDWEAGLVLVNISLLPTQDEEKSTAKVKRRRRASKRWRRRHNRSDDGDVPSLDTTNNECNVCDGCIPIGGGAAIGGDHCDCLCRRNNSLRAPASVSLVQLDDEDVAAGRTADDGELTDDVLSTQKLPTYEAETAAAITAMQASDDLIKTMISFISGEKEKPEKHDILLLSPALRNFFRHYDLFQLSEQRILFRRWTASGGKLRLLLVLSDDEFDLILRRVHEFQPTTLTPASRGRRAVVIGERESRATHAGARRTLETIGRFYYHHEMRKKINSYVSLCPVCVLNNHPRSKRDKQGLQAPMTAGSCVGIDFCGPWNNQSTHRYLFCALDLHSRYAFVYATKSTKDEDVLDCLLRMRQEWAGLPPRFFMDGAICQSRSVSTELLKGMGISITHSLPNNSLCQARVERLIGTISRSILKLQADSPTTPFQRLVDEARIQYNNTSTDNLGGRSPSDLHFFRSNANLIDVDGHVPLSGLTGDSTTARQVADAKRAAQEEVLANDVRRYVQRREKEAAGDRDDRLKVGNRVFKKRTVYWPNSPRKLQFKIDEDAFEIISKIATNSFKCRSVINDRIYVWPGDHLVKTLLTSEQLRSLVARMSLVRNRAGPVPRVSTRARPSVDGVSCPSDDDDDDDLADYFQTLFA